MNEDEIYDNYLDFTGRLIVESEFYILNGFNTFSAILGDLATIADRFAKNGSENKTVTFSFAEYMKILNEVDPYYAKKRAEIILDGLKRLTIEVKKPDSTQLDLKLVTDGEVTDEHVSFELSDFLYEIMLGKIESPIVYSEDKVSIR